jgi:hypothetical protein
MRLPPNLLADLFGVVVNQQDPVLSLRDPQDDCDLDEFIGGSIWCGSKSTRSRVIAARSTG